MSWPQDLTKLLKRISTPAEEVFKGLRVLGDYNKTNLDAHDTGIKAALALPKGTFYYVNDATGSDSNSGLNWTAALKTIGAGIAKLSTGDTLYVGAGNYQENIETPDYVAGPNYVNLIGVGSGIWTPYWYPDDDTKPLLDLQALGWTIRGFRFQSPTDTCAVRLCCTIPTGNDIAIFTTIEDCTFYGEADGKYGIDLYGAPYEVAIRRCNFNFHHQAGGDAAAIVSTNAPYASPYRVRIEDCWFYENDNHIKVGFNVSLIKNCQFNVDGQYTTTLSIDLRGGTLGDNLVTGCALGGTYDNGGGYYCNALGTDFWYGNACEDGFSSANPAP